MDKTKNRAKSTRSVKFKIAAGYLILLAAAFLSGRYIYGEMNRASTLDDYEAQLYTKYNYISQTLYHLNQVENYGQLLLAGYASYDTPYKREMDVVRGYMDSLRLLATESADSLQRERIDSIGHLLTLKEQNILSLRSTIRSASGVRLYNENIDSLLSTGIAPPDMPLATGTPDPLPTENQTITRHDTVVTARKNRPGFFRRLANAFSPGEADSTVVINTRIEQVKVLPPAPAPIQHDTIAALLRNLQGNVNIRRQEIYDEAWKTGNRLRSSNQLVTEKISRLLLDFEREWTQFMVDRFSGQRQASRQASKVLGTAALLSIMLTLVFLFIIWRDINRSNRQKRELEAANRYTEELLKMREKLMLTITHDIKAPLSSIMGYIDLLGRLVKDKRETAYLSNMDLSARHLLRLVNDLLDFHRLDSNKMDINKVTFNPALLFEHLLDSFRPAAEKKGLALEGRIAPGLDRETTGDPLRIRQIADNLLSNAVKFTEKGEITFIAEAGKDGRTLHFTVQDSGRGIPPGEQEKIYREFTRLSSAQGVEGFGLGLSITRKLVQLLGGTISLESEVGKGSAFRVSLPVEPAASGQASAGENRPADAQACDLTGLRGLLIDDDRFQLEITQAMCRQLGITADCCQHPEELTGEAIAAGRYKFILTDIQMPAMNGYDVLRLVRETETGFPIPVIAVTARSDNSRDDFRQAGFSAVLTKPFSRTELAGCIAAATSGGASADCGRQPESRSTEETSRFSALTAFAGDDREAAAGILRSFADEGRRDLSRLRAAAAQCNVPELRAVAHKMLPIYRLLGDEKIVSLLAALEKAPDGIPDEALRQAGEAAAEIERWIGNAENELSLS